MTTDENLSGVGAIAVVDDIRYEAVSGGRSCQGCAGEKNGLVCDALPVGCSLHETIWVRAADQVCTYSIGAVTVDLARAEFEDKAYAYYQSRRAKGDFENHPERGDDSRESLFWKTPDGSYGVHAIQGAWQGFRWGRGLE